MLQSASHMTSLMYILLAVCAHDSHDSLPVCYMDLTLPGSLYCSLCNLIGISSNTWLFCASPACYLVSHWSCRLHYACWKGSKKSHHHRWCWLTWKMSQVYQYQLWWYDFFDPFAPFLLSLQNLWRFETAPSFVVPVHVSQNTKLYNKTDRIAATALDWHTKIFCKQLWSRCSHETCFLYTILHLWNLYPAAKLLFPWGHIHPVLTCFWGQCMFHRLHSFAAPLCHCLWLIAQALLVLTLPLY